MPENPYAEIYADFQKHTQNHQLTVEHDIDGHRTLYVGQPGTGVWSWRVTTSPFYLTIAGDIADEYTFTSTFDMLDFFDRGNRPSHYDDGSPAINPHYWAEKLTRGGRDSVKKYSHDFILACYAIVKTISLYREQAPANDDFIVVQGGLIQNSPALPVFDMDLLDSDRSVDDIFEELFELYERIHDHGDSRRPVPTGLMEYVPMIEGMLKQASGNNAQRLPQMLAGVQERYQRRLAYAGRIE